MYHAKLKRLNDDGHQTLGEFSLYDNRNVVVFKCATLELPWRDNQQRISCIPTGNYFCAPRWSPKYKFHFRLWKEYKKQDVPGRSYILIHPGNYHRHTLGCILVGQDHLDINRDGLRDVTSSKATMRALNQVLRDAGPWHDFLRSPFRLEIR